jgi:hypothetical protein
VDRSLLIHLLQFPRRCVVDREHRRLAVQNASSRGCHSRRRRRKHTRARYLPATSRVQLLGDAEFIQRHNVEREQLLVRRDTRDLLCERRVLARRPTLQTGAQRFLKPTRSPSHVEQQLDRGQTKSRIEEGFALLVQRIAEHQIVTCPEELDPGWRLILGRTDVRGDIVRGEGTDQSDLAARGRERGGAEEEEEQQECQTPSKVREDRWRRVK